MVAAKRASGVKMVGMMKVGAPISLDWVASSQTVGASAFVIFSLHHNIQKMVCKNTILGITPWAYANRR